MFKIKIIPLHIIDYQNYKAHLIFSMLGVKFFSNNESNDWLVRQFEIFKFSDSFLAEKFIPRPDMSIVFHFKDRPLVPTPK